MAADNDDRPPRDSVRSPFKCTACGRLAEAPRQHPLLKVAVCETCHDSRIPTAGATEPCLWCGGSSELLLCVHCPYKFCIACIDRNLGPDYLNFLNEKNWFCLVCDDEPIREHQRECQRLLACSSVTTAVVPSGTGSAGSIISPQVRMDESDTAPRPSQDLDVLLSVYERQLQACMEHEYANLPSIIAEIASIRSDQLGEAVTSYQRCLGAFARDLASLEARLVAAKAAGGEADTLRKLTSLLVVLVQHHVFNRLCRPQARLREDPGRPSAHSTSKHSTNPSPPSSRLESDSAQRVRSTRSLVTPSWLADFKLEGLLESEERSPPDEEWLDSRVRPLPGLCRRGRPPKTKRLHEEIFSGREYLRESLWDGAAVKRGRGRPKKEPLLNVKEVRYCVQKKNGEHLASFS